MSNPPTTSAMNPPARPPIGPMEHASDWDDLWAAGVARGELWDKEQVSPALAAALGERWAPAGTGYAIVPGCGRGYDVELLARSGKFAKAVGVEVSAAGARVAREYLGGRGLDPGSWEIVCADFFDFLAPDGRVDFILDYTFLCALPLARRPDWAARMKELLSPGGHLITLVYPMFKPPEEGGPPHGVSFEHLADLLKGNGFQIEDGPRMLPDDMCHKGREGRTGFIRWQRVD